MADGVVGAAVAVPVKEGVAADASVPSPSPEQAGAPSSSPTAASKAVTGAAAYRADRLRPVGVTARTSHRTRSPADSSNVIILTCAQWLSGRARFTLDQEPLLSGR